MTELSAAPPAAARPLAPVERISEALFGLIMVLTFTCTLSAAQAERAEIRAMLIGALGCNFVWGVIDAVLYLLGCIAERGEDYAVLRSLRRAPGVAEARQVVAAALPPVFVSVLRPDELDRIREQLERLPEPPPRPRFAKADWLGAAGVFLWVFLITFPVALPFVALHEAHTALRISNAIAVVLLYVMGHAFGRAAGLRPIWTGLLMVFLGGGLVAATIALGG
jgi:hypothetical protein